MENSIFLGIDVSKGYADMVLLDSNHQAIEPLLQLDDNSTGYQRLKNILVKHNSQLSNTEIYCGLESTGGYEKNWYDYLLSLTEELPLQVALINPVTIKGVSKASLNRTITDGVSAVNIATYLINYKHKINFIKSISLDDAKFKEGRAMYTYKTMLNKQKVQFNNQLEKLLYQNFPEVICYCRHGIPLWLLRVLSKYPTPESILKAGIEKIKKTDGIGDQRAMKIIDKATNNIKKIGKTMSFIIKNTCDEILSRVQKINESKIFLEKLYKDDQTIKLISSICGIGISSGIEILFEIENVNRFASTKKISSYFGINPEYKESGDGSRGHHLSKKGRKHMRAILYMVCLSAIRHDPMMKSKYASIREKGKCHLFAMGVLMHKMLRIIYGVLKSKVPYNIQIDEANKQKASQKQADLNQEKQNAKKENLKRLRRYQKQNIEKIPISNRKFKKLKELESPQEVLQTQ